YELETWLEFRRVLFRSATVTACECPSALSPACATFCLGRFPRARRTGRRRTSFGAVRPRRATTLGEQPDPATAPPARGGRGGPAVAGHSGAVVLHRAVDPRCRCRGSGHLGAVGVDSAGDRGRGDRLGGPVGARTAPVAPGRIRVG